MKVLVIGGAGRVGRWVVPHFARNHEVTTFDRVAPADVVGDALSPMDVAAALEGQDAVLHLAVVVPRGGDTANPAVLRDAWSTNVGSVWVTLEQARLAGVRRVLLGSTLSVITGVGDRLVDPTEEPDSTLPYGFSKRLAEHAGALYARQFGMHVTSLRLCLPTSDDAAPAWIRPATGERLEMHLPDGTFLPAVAPSVVADHVERGLSFDGEFQVLTVAAPDMPWLGSSA